MPLDYRQVRDIYDTLHDSGVVTQNLPEWSTEMNRLTESDLYSAGLHDNLFKRASVGLDRLLEKTGLPKQTEELGRVVGAAVGAPETGARIGLGLPRLTANFAPLLVPGPGWVTAAGLGLSGLLSGAETYTSTGSPAAGLLSGVTAAALPGVAGAAERAALRGAGARLVEGPLGEGAVSRFFPTTGQNIVGKVAGQAAAAGLMQASEFGQQKIAGEPLDIHPVDMLLNLTLGQAPFALAHLGGRALRSPKEAVDADALQHAVDTSRKTIELRQATDKLAKQSPIETLPDVVEAPKPEVLEETQRLLSQIRGQQVIVKNDPNLTPEDKVKATNGLVEQESQVETRPTANTVFGDNSEVSDRTQVVGTQLLDKPKVRIIHVADVPENPAETRGRVFIYSKGTKEPVPVTRPDGTVVFGLSAPQWRTDRGTLEEYQAKRVPTHPELPTQAQVMSEDELHAHMAELSKVNVEADAAETSGDLQSAVVRLQNVQNENELPITSDATLKDTVEMLNNSGLVDPRDITRTAVKVEATKTARTLRAREQAAPPLSEEEAARVSAMMGEGGFSVVTADKLSHAKHDDIETKPIADVVSDSAVQAAASPNGRTAFNKWEGKADTTFGKEVQDFVDLVEHYGSLANVPVGDAAKFLNDRYGTSGWDAGEVRDFLNRPHVKIWQQELEQRLVSRVERNAAPSAPQDQVFLPDTQQDATIMGQVGTTGGSANTFLQTSESPLIKALGQDLEKFTDSLGRVNLKFSKTKTGGSYALDNGDGTVSVVLSHALLNDRGMLDFAVAHELVHGLTLAELNNPTKAGLVDDFRTIQQKLILALPKDQQARLQELMTGDWKTKFNRGELTYDSILPGGSLKDKQILYSLLNVRELVAQGLSSRDTQEFMRSVRADNKTSWFSRFTNLVKQTLGIGPTVEGSVFEEFLGKTDQLLERGNFVSSFSDFAERYFQNLGMTENLASAQSRRALGVVLDSGFGTSTHDILTSLSDTSLVKSSEFARAQRDLARMFGERSDDFEATTKVMDEIGYRSDARGVDDLSHESLLGLVQHDAIEMLPDPVANYLFAKVKDMQNVLGVLKAATNENNTGLLNLADPTVLRGPVREASKLVDRVLALQRGRDTGRDLIRRMSAIAPDAFLDSHVSAPIEPELAPIAEAFSRETLKKPRRGLGWFLRPVAQLARQNPETAELIDRGFELEPNARQYFGNMVKVLGVDLVGNSKSLSDDSVKAAIKTIQTPRTQRAVDKWMALNNIRARDEKRGVTMLPTSDPAVGKILNGLSQSEREGVIDTVTKTGVMTQVGHVSALNYMAKIASTRAGIIALKDKPIKASQAIELAERTFNAVSADFTDPQAAQRANAELATVSQKMSPDGFLDLLKFTQQEVEKYGLWKQYFTDNPSWATAQRQEKYLVSFVRGGKKFQLQASSTKEAQQIAEGGTNLKIEDNLKGRNDEFPVLGPDAPAMMNRLQELEENQIKMLSERLTPDQIKQIRDTSPVLQFAREAAATGGGIPQFNAPPRLLSQGAEELPWLWNHISWAQRQSNYWTRQLFRAQATLHLSEPELAQNPEMQKMLQQHVDNMLQPDPQLIQRVNRFTSTWFMGFAPASAMVNGMQTLSTLVPELTNITGRPVEAYGRWKNAITEVAKSGFGRKAWSTPELDNLMRNAERVGEIDYSMWDEEAQAHETVATNFKRAIMKNKPQNTWQRVNTISGAWSTAAMWMFKTVEKFNHRVTLVATYNTFREQGMGIDEATNEAFRVNRAVNYGGGRAGRPIGLFAGSDQFTRGAAMLATNMQNYNLGVVSQLSRYLQAGFFRPTDLMPSQVHAARLAATQMLGTQLAAAGLLGLPFASGAVALLNQFFPQLETSRHLREWVDDFFNSDKENGSILTDVAMTGLPSMLGWDMQSRLSMGNITPGVSEFNGFQPELMLGPPVNLVTNFVNGALRLARGEEVGAEAFIPPGLKKLTQLVTSGGTIRDYKDRPQFQPTLGETAGIALGFNPKRLSDSNAADRMLQQSQDVSNRREGQFNQGLAEEVLKGNFGTVGQTLRERAQQDNTFDPVAAVRTIARSAEELTFPRDLRREGTGRTATARSRLLSTFRIDPTQPTEALRLQFRRQIEQRLGLRSTSSSEDRLAQVMDQLRSQNPDATRSELRREAEQALRGYRRNASLLPELP